MASSFYFFTDVDLLASQTSAQAYGPAGTYNDGVNNFDQFHITSVHTATSDSSAYAVCDGTALVQDAGNSLVNLILKPTSQPPFAFPKVKYFIYRGIKIGSLVDTNNTDIAPTGTNDLTQSLWDSQTALNNANQTSFNPPKQALGIDITTTGSIDPVFFRTGVSYQLPMVKAGWKIGTFSAAGFGFEVLTESVGFDPQLQDARSNDFFIRVQQLSGSPAQADQFGYAHDKEAILNYIDPSAFFGNFYQFNLNTKDSTGADSSVTEGQVYDNVLKGLILTAISDGFFYNRMLTYLDIRNEINQSFNYFQNYGNNIQIAYDGSSALVAQNFYVSGWPVLAINANSFALNTSTSPNILRLSMPDGSGDNTLPLIYISTGILSTTYPDEPKQAAKMIDLTITSGWSNEIALNIPNRDSLATTSPVSSYIRLKYFKQFDSANPPQVSSGTVIRAQNFLDQLFIPLTLKIPFSNTNVIKSLVIDQDLYVGVNDILNLDFIGRLGRIDDGANFIFFSLPDIIRSGGPIQSIPASFTSEINSDTTNSFVYIASKDSNIDLQKIALQLPQSIDCVNLVDTEMVTGESSGADFSSIDQMVTIGVTQSELNAIDVTSFDSNYPIFLGFTNQQDLTDDGGQSYFTYDLLLRGYQVSGGTIAVNELTTSIKIYFYAAN